jgi:hypothetical protein
MKICSFGVKQQASTHLRSSKYQFYIFGLTRTHPRSSALEAMTLTITTMMLLTTFNQSSVQNKNYLHKYLIERKSKIIISILTIIVHQNHHIKDKLYTSYKEYYQKSIGSNRINRSHGYNKFDHVLPLKTFI